MLSKLRGYRTYLFNGSIGILYTVIAILQELQAMPEIMALVPADYARWLTLALVIGNIVLRHVTTTPSPLPFTARQ